MSQEQQAPDRSEIEKTKRVMLGDMDWIKVHDLLKTHLILIGGADLALGLVKYPEGWSDKRIADEVGGTATDSNVAYRREKHFGKLPPKVVSSPGNDPRVDGLLEELVVQDGMIRGLTKEMLELQAGSSDQEGQIDDLSRRLKAYGEQTTITEIAEIKDRFNRLIAAIKMAHIGDFRGLMYEEGK